MKDMLYDSNPSSDGENYDDDDFDEGEIEESPEPEHVTPNHRQSTGFVNIVGDVASLHH